MEFSARLIRRSFFAQCLVPALLVLHGLSEPKLRMQSVGIVEGHPVHDGRFRLLQGSEAVALYTSSWAAVGHISAKISKGKRMTAHGR